MGSFLTSNGKNILRVFATPPPTHTRTHTFPHSATCTPSPWIGWDTPRSHRGHPRIYFTFKPRPQPPANKEKQRKTKKNNCVQNTVRPALVHIQPLQTDGDCIIVFNGTFMCCQPKMLRTQTLFDIILFYALPGNTDEVDGARLDPELQATTPHTLSYLPLHRTW